MFLGSRARPVQSLVIVEGISNEYLNSSAARGSVVIKTLCYKPEGYGFETRRGELIFFSLGRGFETR
jgi:hypothetical protein